LRAFISLTNEAYDFYDEGKQEEAANKAGQPFLKPS
jgi:hypothetical protein